MRNRDAFSEGSDPVSLSAEEEQLQEELKSLDQQYEVLTQQQRELEIRSPVDGRVLTFDLERLLAERPVRRGDRLMTVADVDGPWELELQIDDDQAGHVLDAWEQSDGRLPVSFLLVGQAGVRCEAHLVEVAEATEIDELGRAIVPAHARLESRVPAGARPGTTVIAKIHCGRRSIGFVWFRPLLEAIRTRVLF
jgi:hypothetical protein